MVDPVAVAQRPGEPAARSKRRPNGGLRQVLLEWRGLRIHSYPVMIYLGLTLGLVAGDYVANLAGMDAARVFAAILVLAIAGLVGARLMFVATHWASYRSQPRRIWRRAEGGAAVQGGLLLAVAASPPLLAALGLPLGAFWDVATFVMLIWSIFGRFGCLLHGCCSGRPSSGRFTLYLPDHRGVWCRRIPTQLLEAGFGLLLLIAAAALWSRRPFPGALFLASVAAYSAARVILLPLRAEQERIGALSVHRAIAIGVAVLSLGVLVMLWLGQYQNS